jgi:hypothetical protein
LNYFRTQKTSGRNVSTKTRHVLSRQKCFDENASRFAPAKMFRLKRVTFCSGKNVSAKTRHVLSRQKCLDENASRFSPAKMEQRLSTKNNCLWNFYVLFVIFRWKQVVHIEINL